MKTETDIEKIEKLASDMKDVAEMNFGSRLQRKRLSKKISIDDIADRTCISRDFLYALEANDYEKLPSEAYTIGFIRTCCKVLDIDSTEYVSEYQRYLAISRHNPKRKNIADNMVTLQRQSRRRFYVFLFALLLMVMGVGATIGFIYYQNVLETKNTTTIQQNGTIIPPGGTNSTTPSLNSGLQQPPTTSP